MGDDIDSGHEPSPTWLMRRTLSFRYAFRGIWVATAGPNFRLQLVGAAASAIVATAFGIRRTHVGLVIVAIAMVLSAELLNTAVERLCDLVVGLHGLGWDARIRDIKDLCAAAVLVVSIGAAAIGVIVFDPSG